MERLSQFVSRTAREDYSWARPNKRFTWADLYLPALNSKQLAPIVALIDVSGSIGEDLLAEFGGRVSTVAGMHGAEVVLVYHDVQVQAVQKWSPSDGPLKMKTVGGGGTSHVPAFEWINSQVWEEAPSCVICLTDMESTFPSQGPEFPTLWIQSGGRKEVAPFGEKVRIR